MQIRKLSVAGEVSIIADLHDKLTVVTKTRSMLWLSWDGVECADAWCLVLRRSRLSVCCARISAFSAFITAAGTFESWRG